MTTLPLSPDELLSTTRAVRKRLDLSRPVERHLLEECLHLAHQAPSGSNLQNWHFVVTDPGKRAVLAACRDDSPALPTARHGPPRDRDAQSPRAVANQVAPGRG